MYFCKRNCLQQSQWNQLKNSKSNLEITISTAHEKRTIININLCTKYSKNVRT